MADLNTGGSPDTLELWWRRLTITAQAFELKLDTTHQGPSDGSHNDSLLTDLYQFNMIQAYLEHSETKTAVFEFFVRKLPAQRDSWLRPGSSKHSSSSKACASRLKNSNGWQARAGLEQDFSTISQAFVSTATSMRCARAPYSSPTSRFPRDGAPARSSARRNTPYQYSAFPVADRGEGGAHGAPRTE